jgi:hypothetical protein
MEQHDTDHMIGAIASVEGVRAGTTGRGARRRVVMRELGRRRTDADKQERLE